MPKEKTKTSDVCARVDDYHARLSLELSLRGVHEKDINLRMHGDSFSLNATKEDVEYDAAVSFCCPVKSKGC